MVVKVYVSMCSGNIEMKTRQDYIVRILESRKITFEQIDISDQSQESEKAFMRKNSVTKEGQRVPLPPQIFYDEQYCGDYDGFLDANEDDAIYEFLKLAPEKKVSVAEIKFTEISEDAINKNGVYEEDTFDIDMNKENMNVSTENKEDPLVDIIEAAAVESDEKHDVKKDDDDAPSQSEQDSSVKDSNATGDNKIVHTSDSLERASECEDSTSLHDYENVVLTQDGDGNTVVDVKVDVKEVVDVKEETDSGSLHDYENVVLTRDGEGNTVVQLRQDGQTEDEGKEKKPASGENGAAAVTEVTSGGD